MALALITDCSGGQYDWMIFVSLAFGLIGFVLGGIALFWKSENTEEAKQQRLFYLAQLKEQENVN